jgi:hypothetical protein
MVGIDRVIHYETCSDDIGSIDMAETGEAKGTYIGFLY